jgi:hypothetical protein
VLGLRVALLDRLVKPQEGPLIKMGPLPGQQPPRVYVQARCHATGRVVDLALLGRGPITAHRGIPLSHAWAAHVGSVRPRSAARFAPAPGGCTRESSRCVAPWLRTRSLAAVPGNRLDALPLGFVLAVWRVDRASTPLVVHAPAIQGLPDGCQAAGGQPGNHLAYARQPPAGARQVQQAGRALQGRLDLPASRLDFAAGKEASLRPRPFRTRSPATPSRS